MADSKIIFGAIFLFFFFLFFPKNIYSEDIYPPWHEETSIVDEPLENVLDAVSNCENYSALFPYLHKSKLLYKNLKKRNHVCYIESSVLNQKYWAEIQTHSKKIEKNTFHINGVTLKKNIQKLEFEWLLEKLSDNKTKVSCRFRIDLDLPFGEEILQRYAKRSLKRAVLFLTIRKY